MKHIEFIKKFEFGGEIQSEKDIEAKQLYKGSGRQIMEIKLRNNAVLSKHKAAEPITVFCLAGNGKFLAGENLEDEHLLEKGTFITLEANILHEVSAESELHIIVTKFKQD
ncbi:MAG: hypothetical protein ACR2MD_11790 [Aridibacter sp.]|jgi:quercetin dioxygenase-like cupin family protein